MTAACTCRHRLRLRTCPVHGTEVGRYELEPLEAGGWTFTSEPVRRWVGPLPVYDGERVDEDDGA